MKVFKIVGIGITVLLILFLGTGLLTPYFEYDVEVTVNAPTEKCWSVLHDTSRMKNWMPGFVSLTLKEGENLKPGSKYEVILKQDELYIMQEMLKEINPPTLAVYELNNEVMTSEYDFKLTQGSLQTKISTHYKIMGNNLIWRSILSLSRSYLQNNAQSQLDYLKTEIENGSAPTH